MEFLRLVLIFAHFLGMAMLVGGFLAQIPQQVRQVSSLMLRGAITQLLTGVAIVWLYEAADSLDESVDRPKVGVKLVVVLIITALAFLYRRQDRISNMIFFVIGGLAVLNTAIAVFWT